MNYVFDTSILIVMFKHYYKDRFPSLWKKFEECVNQERIISVREAGKEIDKYHAVDDLTKWKLSNPSFFPPPTEKETKFITEIFSIRHFQMLVDKKKIGGNYPIADPFVIAKAKFYPITVFSSEEKGTVVTMESYKLNAARIPNVCEHFDIKCFNFEDFMKNENWQF